MNDASVKWPTPTTDGFPQGIEGNNPSLPKHLVVLPADMVIRHCRGSLHQLGVLTGLDPFNVMIETFRLTHLGDYDSTITQIRKILMDVRPEAEPSMLDVHRFVDALSDLHTNVMEFFHHLYKKPYRLVEPIRMIGNDGVVMRVYT